MGEEYIVYLNKREAKLIKYGRGLDPNSRHHITVIYRGREPWEIEEHVIKKKIELIPSLT